MDVTGQGRRDAPSGPLVCVAQLSAAAAAAAVPQLEPREAGSAPARGA